MKNLITINLFLALIFANACGKNVETMSISNESLNSNKLSSIGDRELALRFFR